MNALASSFYPTVVCGAGVGAALFIGRVGAILGPLVGGFLISMGYAGASIFLLLIVPAAICTVSVHWVRRVHQQSHKS